MDPRTKTRSSSVNGVTPGLTRVNRASSRSYRSLGRVVASLVLLRGRREVHGDSLEASRQHAPDDSQVIFRKPYAPVDFRHHDTIPFCLMHVAVLAVASEILIEDVVAHDLE